MAPKEMAPLLPPTKEQLIAGRIVIVWLPVAETLFLSRTVTVKDRVPEIVGVPVIMQFSWVFPDVVSASPEGRPEDVHV